MDLEDAGTRARFLVRDRDGKYPDLFDAILTDAGIEVVLSGVRMPRMNSIMERWVQTCRHEFRMEAETVHRRAGVGTSLYLSCCG
jgi:putative transposase